MTAYLMFKVALTFLVILMAGWAIAEWLVGWGEKRLKIIGYRC